MHFIVSLAHAGQYIGSMTAHCDTGLLFNYFCYKSLCCFQVCGHILSDRQ